MSIFFNNSSINDWNFGDDNIIKVYRNNAVCYYKITGGGDTPTAQTPCFAVVDDISQYSDTEFEDVFNLADEKWYKRNNLNQYEEYGIYGSGRTITTYDGKLTVDDGYEYMYSGGSWINVGEVSGSTATLPDVPFTLNYNAKNYDSSTHVITKTSGQLNDIDAVITGTTSSISDYSSDGYIRLTGSSSTPLRARVSNSSVNGYFNRNNTNPNLTVIAKILTQNSNTADDVLVNRDRRYNWMYRHKPSLVTLHGSSEQGSIAVSNTVPNICSARVASNRLLTYNNWTQNTTSTYSNFNYGSTTSDGGTLFASYATDNSYFWKGDFYWIYMSQNTLTDEQVQQVIDYNEGSSQPIYPIYYDEIQDPPNNLTFSSMTEAEAYECPWVGMRATIDGDNYIFSGDSISGYEWVYTSIDYSTHYLTLVAQTDNVTFAYSTATSSNKLNYSLDGGSTWSELGNNQSTTSINSGDKIMFRASGLTVNTERGIGKIIPSASVSVEGNIMSLAYGDNFSGQTVVPNNYQFRKLFSGVTTITSAENMVLPATTVKQQCYSQMFDHCSSLTATPKVIGASAMTWSGNYCFSNLFSYCTSLTTVPSGLLPALNLGTQCYWYMFEGCSGLTESPILSAQNLVTECYRGMFMNCTSLNYIKVLASNGFSMTEWVKNVASSGTFVKNSTATFGSCGQNTVPCGWTIENA